MNRRRFVQTAATGVLALGGASRVMAEDLKKKPDNHAG